MLKYPLLTRLHFDDGHDCMDGIATEDIYYVDDIRIRKQKSPEQLGNSSALW